MDKRARVIYAPQSYYLKGKTYKSGSPFMVSSTRRHAEAFECFIDESVVDFFNHVNMLYGTISEFCTPEKVLTTSF